MTNKPSMHADSSQTEAIRYVRLPLDAAARWRRRESFACVAQLGQLPLSDSELLVCSHHLPIAIDSLHDRLQVVAITSSQFQRTPLVDAEGQWRRGYAPIALRCLPFRLAEDGGGALEIAVNLRGHAAAEAPALDDKGTVAADIKQAVGLLRRLEAGRRRLQLAAEKLLIADVLAPFQVMRAPGGASVRSRILTVDRNKFAALSQKRVSHIARDDFLAIDLVAACLFSQRLVPAPISVAVEPGAAAEIDPGQAPQIQFKSNTQLDDSELFSFDAFVRAGQRDD
jgi:hypothetical protein